jgi:hypothetical protein
METVEPPGAQSHFDAASSQAKLFQLTASHHTVLLTSQHGSGGIESTRLSPP